MARKKELMQLVKNRIESEIEAIGLPDDKQEMVVDAVHKALRPYGNYRLEQANEHYQKARYWAERADHELNPIVKAEKTYEAFTNSLTAFGLLMEQLTHERRVMYEGFAQVLGVEYEPDPEPEAANE